MVHWETASRPGEGCDADLRGGGSGFPPLLFLSSASAAVPLFLWCTRPVLSSFPASSSVQKNGAQRISPPRTGAWGRGQGERSPVPSFFSTTRTKRVIIMPAAPGRCWQRSRPWRPNGRSRATFDGRAHGLRPRCLHGVFRRDGGRRLPPRLQGGRYSPHRISNGESMLWCR